LRIRATVLPSSVPTSPFIADPKMLESRSMSGGFNRAVALKNITTKKVGMKLIYEDDDYFNVTLPDSLFGPGETAKALVSIKEDRPEEDFIKSFTIEFSDKDRTRMSIPVMVTRSKSNRSGGR